MAGSCWKQVASRRAMRMSWCAKPKPARRVYGSGRDNVFIGRILGIRTIISFHGETVEGLRAEFELAVKDYVADCREQGIRPEKPASGKLLLRVPPEVHGRALVAAQASGKSLNQWATEVLKQATQAS